MFSMVIVDYKYFPLYLVMPMKKQDNISRSPYTWDPNIDSYFTLHYYIHRSHLQGRCRVDLCLSGLVCCLR